MYHPKFEKFCKIKGKNLSKPTVHPGVVIKNILLDTRFPAFESITEFAKHLGVTRPALSSLINCRSSLSIEMAWKIDRLVNEKNNRPYLSAENLLLFQLYHDLTKRMMKENIK